MGEAVNPEVVARARGCLLGQLAGDALGSLVEFRSPGEIRATHSDGVRDMADGGTWNTLAGQPTDDSEMALLLARMLVDHGAYDPDAALSAYRFWIGSGPFDCGATIASALAGRPNPESQANGALMRVSPLGIFGAGRPRQDVADWAMRDAALTHPHPVCLQANALFAMAIARAVATGRGGAGLHGDIRRWAVGMDAAPSLVGIIDRSACAPPSDFLRHEGWVLTALQNALWQLLHAPDLESGVIDTVGRGGDTDTNAAICGALLGAVHGRGAIPLRWSDTVLGCRPEGGRPGVRRPRPRVLWPVDALELADRLVGG